MFTSTDLKAIITEVRPIIERQLDDAEIIAGFREKVTAQGGDWSQIKALVKAMIQDERDESGGSERVLAILHKADHALGYADMLGIGKLNEKFCISGSEPDHDPETGEVFEPDAAAASPAGVSDAGEVGPAAAAVATASLATQSTAAGMDRRDNSTGSALAPTTPDPGAATTLPAGQALPVDTHQEPPLAVAPEPTITNEGGAHESDHDPDHPGSVIDRRRQQHPTDEDQLREERAHEMEGTDRPVTASEEPGRSIAPDSMSPTQNPGLVTSSNPGLRASTITRPAICLNPTTCGGMGRQACYSCRKAAARRASITTENMGAVN